MAKYEVRVALGTVFVEVEALTEDEAALRAAEKVGAEKLWADYAHYTVREQYETHEDEGPTGIAAFRSQRSAS